MKVIASRHPTPVFVALVVGAILVTPCGATESIALDPDDIAGVVHGPMGPEAGVWVIAETDDLPTKMAKIVVTDDQGRYLLPDLPKAGYRVWVRGYGLVDSRPVEAAPGEHLDLTAVPAPDSRAAAQYYPASYWLSLLDIPPSSDFPGTGRKGNGISTTMRTQAHWLFQVKETCEYCHQLGTRATREIPPTLGKFDSSREAWAHRVTLGPNGAYMSSVMRQFGPRGIEEFAAWTDRIAAGAIPAETPPRPSGLERNLVLTLWDWAGGEMIHDEISTDKRRPTLNAGGRVYGVSTHGGNTLVWVDPQRNTATAIPVPSRDPEVDSSPHNPMMDELGRVWITSAFRDPAKSPAYCTDPANPYAKFFPLAEPQGSLRQVSVFDPKSGRFQLIDTCFGTHHLQFAWDAARTLYLSGDVNAIGWIDTRKFDKTHDVQESIGWCPMVLDTNGDGHIGEWTEPGEPDDPKKDTRLIGFLYGMGVSPADGSVWYARYAYGSSNDWKPGVPGGLIRFVRGARPPATCQVEYYEPPLSADGQAMAFNPRGVDLDSEGVAWVAFGSGQIGRFDRRRCPVTKGPTATGQHCAAGWTLHTSPGPNFKGVGTGSADWHYLTWVDQHDVLGLGKDTPIMPGSESDSLLVFWPRSNSFLTLRVPYPLGFYARGLDGRIDDPKAGWKGRAIWSSFDTQVTKHIEGGPGTNSRLVKFQLRPDPLAR